MNRKLPVVAALALLMASGCGGGGGGGNSSPSQLTGEQQTAASDVTLVFATAKLVGELAADAAGTSQLPATACPIVTRSGSVTTFNFGAGCSGPATDGQTVAGAVLVDTDADTITFQSLKTNERTVTGSVTFLSAGGGNTVVLTFNNLAVSGIGSINGIFQETRFISGTTIATVLDTPPTAPGGDGAIVITPAVQGYTPCSFPSNASYSIGLNGLTIDGKANNNLIPQSGSATIGFSSVHGGSCSNTTISLGFTASSPSNKSVKVSVNGSSPVTITFGSL